jgi:hypothetical protein
MGILLISVFGPAMKHAGQLGHALTHIPGPGKVTQRAANARSSPAQAVAVQLIDAGYSHKLHAALDLVFEQLDRAFDPGLASCREGIKV